MCFLFLKQRYSVPATELDALNFFYDLLQFFKGGFIVEQNFPFITDI